MSPFSFKFLFLFDFVRWKLPEEFGKYLLHDELI